MAISVCGSLLASAMFLGQTSDAPLPIQTTPDRSALYQYQSSSSTTQPQPQPQRGPIISWFTREDRPVLSRIQSWFGRKDPKEQNDTSEPPVMQSTTTPRGTIINDGAPLKSFPIAPTNAAPVDFPKRMPNPTSQNTPATDVPASEEKSKPNTAPAVKPATFGPVTPKVIEQTSLNVPAAPTKSPILPKLANKIGREEHFEWITGQLEIENGAYVIYYATPETIDQFHGRLVLQLQKVDVSTFRRSDLVCVRGDLIQRPSAHGPTGTYRLSDMQLIEHAK